jgi:hypothetical protein
MFKFIDCQSALPPHLQVLVHHAMDAPLLHGFRIMDMLRLELAALHQQDPNKEK